MSSETPGTSNSVRIRLAENPADLPVILSLAEQTWAPTYQKILAPEQLHYMFGEIYQPAAIARQMNEGQQFLLLYQNQIPAGFAAYSPLAEPYLFKLNKLYVLPTFHGCGFGGQLIRAVEAAAKAARGTILQLNVNRNNPAKSFYEKCGYSVAYEEDIPIGPYFMNDYVMQKNLVAT